MSDTTTAAQAAHTIAHGPDCRWEYHMPEYREQIIARAQELGAVLADELATLGATVLGRHGGGVRFEGDAAVGWSVNLHSRIASRA